MFSSNYLHTRTYFWQWRNNKIFNISMDIVCDTHIDELIHDRVLCLQLIIIIQRITWKIHINNKTILHSFNLWSKEVPVNISYPSTINQIDRYVYEIISPVFSRYIMLIKIKK